MGCTSLIKYQLVGSNLLGPKGHSPYGPYPSHMFALLYMFALSRKPKNRGANVFKRFE